MKLLEQIRDSMQKALMDSIDSDLLGVFTAPPTVPDSLSLADLGAAWDAIVELSPKLSWRRDAGACRQEDMKAGRGTLILNPGVNGASDVEGGITEKDGIEYRVICDEALRGAKDKDGLDAMGYWLAPQPALELPPIVPVSPRPVDDFMRYRFMYEPFTVSRSVYGCTSVELDSTIDRADECIAVYSSPNTRSKKRQMVRYWRQWCSEHPSESMSLKEYARSCKWGRDWLTRKVKR